MGPSMRRRKLRMGKQFGKKRKVILDMKMTKRVETKPPLLLLMMTMINHCCEME